MNCHILPWKDPPYFSWDFIHYFDWAIFHGKMLVHQRDTPNIPKALWMILAKPSGFPSENLQLWMILGTHVSGANLKKDFAEKRHMGTTWARHCSYLEVSRIPKWLVKQGTVKNPNGLVTENVGKTIGKP